MDELDNRAECRCRIDFVKPDQVIACFHIDGHGLTLGYERSPEDSPIYGPYFVQCNSGHSERPILARSCFVEYFNTLEEAEECFRLKEREALEVYYG